MKFKIIKVFCGLPRYVVVIIFAVVSLTPLIWIWSSALKTHMEIFINPFAPPSKFYIDNLVKAWNLGRFSKYTLNSVIITVPTAVGVILLSSLAGYAFGKLRFYGRDILFYVSLFGLTLPFQAVMIPLYYLMLDIGIISTYPAVILPAIGFGLPFGTFMMRAFFKSIPTEVMDAARVDGCTDLQIFLKVMLPLALPAISTLAVLQSLWTWNELLIPLLFLQRQELHPLTLGLMFFKGRYTQDYGLIFAGATIMSLPIVGLYLVLHRHFIKGITAGTIK